MDDTEECLMSHTKKNKPWIFIFTHGEFGEALKNTAEMILGKMEHVYCFSLLEEMEPKAFIDQIKEATEGAPKHSLIFTDLFGGTPSNVAATFAEDFTVISGVNLPMLIEAEMQRTQGNLAEKVEKIMFSATDGIKNVSQIMEERRRK